MERFQNSDSERIIQLLDDEIRSRSYGTIRNVDRAAGFKAGWWQNRVRSGDLTVGQMLKVLDYLGLDPVKFMRRAAGSDDGLELDRPPGKAPSLVARAERRFQEDIEGRGVGLRWIESLDDLRYEDPEKAVRSAQLHVDDVELQLLPNFLGVVGSAWRLRFCTNEADHAIQCGLRIAQTNRDLSLQGNLLQRLSYVIGDRGMHLEALRKCEVAAILFLRSGNRAGMANTLVDQGIWRSRLGQSQASIETMKSALEILPDNEYRNRFAAFQVVGLNLLRMGKLSSALDHCLAAERDMAALGKWDKGKLTWLKAQVFAKLDDLDTAGDLFQKVVATFRNLHPGEAALATCELVRIQLLKKEPARAYATARSMAQLMEPLRHNQIVSAAIGDLLRTGQEGLTLALLERVRFQIESERTNKSWRFLRINP